MPGWEDLAFWMVHLCQLRPKTGWEETEETSPAGVSQIGGAVTKEELRARAGAYARERGGGGKASRREGGLRLQL